MTGSRGAVEQPRYAGVDPSGLPATLRAQYRERHDEIESRLGEFRAMWRRGNEEDLFGEMTFCLCAVQTAARVSDQATRALRESGLLLRGTRNQVRDVLRRSVVRFHKNKSRWIVEARRRFMEPSPTIRRELNDRAHAPLVLRDWLEREVLGFGPKEASHFLRNVGLGEDLAILDRHILRNLVEFEVLDVLPPSLTRARYHEIEGRFRAFCERTGIPLGHMDLLLWAKETGFVFK